MPGNRVPNRARAIALALACGVTLLMPASPARGWYPASVVSDSGNATAYPASTGVTGRYVTHIAFSDRIDSARMGAVYRRSTNGGNDWSPAVRLSSLATTGGFALALEAGDTYVDVLISEWDAGVNNSVLWYRRSTTDGRSWHDPVRLTRLQGEVSGADVTRAGSRVTVIWSDYITGDVFIRISTDGGATFGGRLKVGATTNVPNPDQDNLGVDARPVVSEAAGIINIAWNRGNHTIRARRSVNGTTWSAPVTLATNGDGRDLTIATLQQKVIVGYTSVVNGYPRATYRRSTNAGASWQAAQLLGGRNTFTPNFALRHWLHATYKRCTWSDCSRSVAMYAQSLDWGASWYLAEEASRGTTADRVAPVGIVGLYGGRATVTYLAQSGSDGWNLYSRRR